VDLRSSIWLRTALDPARRQCDCFVSSRRSLS